MSESLEERFNKLLIALNRLAIQVSRHNGYIAEIGTRVNQHTDSLSDIADILESSIPPESYPNYNKSPVVIKLLADGDNVVSCPKFLERRP